MELSLNAVEARVLGCLLEKELSTPEYYPLTLNALTAACNQKSNREPVVKFAESTVREALHSLTENQLAWEKTISGRRSRVTKYAHKLSGTLSKTIDFNLQQRAVLAELLLRGPQTPGELRTRTNRMCEFPDVGSIETTLRELTEHKDGPFVVELPRQPGRREHRFSELLSEGREAPAMSHAPNPPPSVTPEIEERLSALETKVLALESELATLRRNLGEE